MGSSYTPPVNLASPGAIGGTTPAAITGTTITANTQLVVADSVLVLRGATSTTTGIAITGNQVQIYAAGGQSAIFTASNVIFNVVVYGSAAGFCSAADGSGMTFDTAIVKLLSGATEKLRACPTGVRVVLPTSASGLVAGDLWNNSGVVTIVT